MVNQKLSPFFIDSKEEQFQRDKKYLLAYVTLAFKVKQRTDGFIDQNFPKLREEL